MDGSELVGSLRELSALREAGALTEEEFAGAKAWLLGRGNGHAAASAAHHSAPTAPRPRGTRPAAPVAPAERSDRGGAASFAAVIVAVTAVVVLVAAVFVVREPAGLMADARGTSAPGLAVPDNTPTGVTDAIILSGGGTADRIQLEATISHSYSPDVVVQLFAPSGRSATIFNHASVYGSGITIGQDSADPGSPLQALLGEPVAGAWQLTVTDLASADIGTLNNWAITIER